jgi:PAS domain S-box-containing protein
LLIALILLTVFATTSLFLYQKIKLLTEELKKSQEEKIELESEYKKKIGDETSRRLDSEDIFISLFENSNEGIYMLSNGGKFIMCNAAGASVLGYDQVELIGKSLAEISPVFQKHLNQSSFDAIEVVFEDVFLDSRHRFEWSCLKKDSSEVLLEMVMFLLNRSGKKELFMIGRDITELKKLQKEKEADQALIIQQTKLAELGSMIGVISHQWKQPVNTISLLTQVLEDDFYDNELNEKTIKEHVKDVKKQIDFMMQTMDDFRDFYKPSKEKTIFSVFKVVASVKTLMEGQFLKDKIIVELKGDNKLLSNGYSSEFKQVVLNILNNARDAFESNEIKARKISINIVQHVDKVDVSISDNAGGIPEAIIDKIFEPFVSSKGDNGTGVGLSLSRTIIEKMDGHITVENIENGAKFTIRIPLIK